MERLFVPLRCLKLQKLSKWDVWLSAYTQSVTSNALDTFAPTPFHDVSSFFFGLLTQEIRQTGFFNHLLTLKTLKLEQTPPKPPLRILA